MKSRIVSIDYGQSRIGIAVSDESKILAGAFKTITSEYSKDLTADKLLKNLQDISSEIEKIVIGLPLQLNGKPGTMAESVKDFVKILTTKTNIPIVTWDERLTTSQAERIMKSSQISRKKRAKVIDVTSAVIILQNFLDANNL